MKKFFAVLAAIALCFVFTSSAMSMGGYHAPVDASGVAGHDIAHGTDTFNGGSANSFADAEFDAEGNDFAKGSVGTSGDAHAVGYGDGGNFGFSSAGATTRAFGNTDSGYSGRCGDRDPYDHVSVSGGVNQSNGAAAYDSSTNKKGNKEKGDAGASGGNTSGGEFSASDADRTNAGAYGGADTNGFTVVGAFSIHKGGATTSVAGGYTANEASAFRGCNDGGASVYGSGEMNTGTFASTKRGNAWTSSSSSYMFSDEGRYNASGSGSAWGAGYSNVTNTSNGVKASSYSTSGATSNSGGGSPD